MGRFYKLIFASLLVAFLTFVILNVFCTNKKENYSEKLKNMLSEQKTIKVSDVFPFEFEKAYVFDDPYISGDGFSKKYSLDISIQQVDSGVTESIQRIVFVDENGSYVYEFNCDIEDIIISELGVVIYPETSICLLSSTENGDMIIRFDSLEYYDESRKQSGDG